MLDGRDGSLITSKILYCYATPTYCSKMSMLIVTDVLYIPVADNIVLHYRDLNAKWFQYVTLLRSSDLGYITTYSVFDLGNSNDPWMKVSLDLTGTVPYIETAGLTTYYNGQQYLMYYVGFVSSTAITSTVAKGT